MCGIARLVQHRRTVEALAGLAMPSVIIAASGMATGGRVLHLKTAPTPTTTCCSSASGGGTRTRTWWAARAKSRSTGGGFR